MCFWLFLWFNVGCLILKENATLKEQLAAFCGTKSMHVPVKNLANGFAICAVIFMVAVNFNVVRLVFLEQVFDKR